jgi:hypothetical protein
VLEPSRSAAIETRLAIDATAAAAAVWALHDDHHSFVSSLSLTGSARHRDEEHVVLPFFVARECNSPKKQRAAANPDSSDASLPAS